jgi:hypothetical protein
LELREEARQGQTIGECLWVQGEEVLRESMKGAAAE